MTRPNALIAAALAVLALTLPASAFAADEVGDAGELPGTAQDLSSEAVSQISGSFDTGADADVYRVCLEGGGTFSASTVGGTNRDTQLFLFDAEGHGVYGNDDAQATRQSELPAFDALTPAEPGVYLLGISGYNRDPRGASGEIFPDSGGVLAPSSDDPLTSWSRTARLGGDYAIALTGTTACAPPDQTPPTVDLRVPEDGASVARGSDVAVDFDCADEGGSGLASCEGSVADGSPLDTSSLGDRSVTVTARDVAGNETVVTHTAHVVDATDPSVSLLSPLHGAVYLLGQDVRADYSCADDEGGSGIASCTGDVPVGDAVDTGSVGAKEFTATAQDAAGNTASITNGYRVVYDFRFRRPSRHPRRVRAGRLVIVRFSIDGFHGRNVMAEGFPQVAVTQCGDASEPESGDPARILGGLQWLRHGRSYLLVWKTDRSWAGTCRQFLVGLDDGTVHGAAYRFKR